MIVKTYKTIVVGVDFSDYSQIIFKQAQLLAGLWHSQLVVVHAIHEPIEYNSSAIYVAEPNIVSTESHIHDIQKAYHITDDHIQIIAQRGYPDAILTQIASKTQDPLILIGHKGQGKIADFLFGSTARSFIAKSNFPVWVQLGKTVIHPDQVLVQSKAFADSNLKKIQVPILIHP